MDVSTTYEEGIDRAKKAGIIEGTAPNGDSFSHLTDGIIDTNSRLTDPAVMKILESWPKDSKPKIMEIGPGVGISASTIKRIIPDATLHTMAGRAPINPYWEFSEEVEFANRNKDKNRVDNARAAIFQQISDKLGKNDALNLTDNKSLEHVMELQEKVGLRVLDVTEKPYIDYQWCGDFLDPHPFANGTYDIVYESYGPNFHLARGNDGAKTRQALKTTIDLLRPGGIIIMNRRWIKPDPSYIHVQSMHLSILLHKDNFIAKKMTEIFGENNENPSWSHFEETLKQLKT